MRYIGLNMSLGRQGVDHWIPGIKWGGCKNENGDGCPWRFLSVCIPWVWVMLHIGEHSHAD